MVKKAQEQLINKDIKLNVEQFLLQEKASDCPDVQIIAVHPPPLETDQLPNLGADRVEEEVNLPNDVDIEI